MHLGHQSVIEIARKTSNKSSLGVVTFEPHPRQYFQKNQPPFTLWLAQISGLAKTERAQWIY